MNYRKLLNSIVFFLSLTALSNPVNYNASFCGWDPQWEDSYYPIVDQYSLVDNKFYPFLNCPDSPFCDKDFNASNIDQNIEEWCRYLDKEFTVEELKNLIYVKNISWIKSRTVVTDADNKLFEKLYKSKHDFFIKYLLLAKKTAKTSSDNGTNAGWYQGEYDSSDLYDKQELLTETFELIAVAPDDFMKNRLGYQAVRLLHYLQNNKTAVAYFKNVLKPSVDYPYIYYRAMEQMAGAAYNLQEYELAAKSYLTVYHNLPDRSYNNALSLRLIPWGKLDQNMYAADKNKMDVASFFKVFHGNGSVVYEMQNISRRDVNSPYLNLLAVRIIDQLQSSTFEHNGYEFYDDYDGEWNEKKSQDFIKLSNEILSTAHLADKDLWNLLKSMIYLKRGETTEALQFIQENENPNYRIHFKRLKTAIAFMGINEVDRIKIDAIFQIIKNDAELNSHHPTTAAFFNHISALYHKENNLITSALTSVSYDTYNNDNVTWDFVLKDRAYSDEYNSVYSYLDEDIINNFDRFISLQNPTDFEKVILKRMQKNPQDFTHDLRGTYYMMNDRLDEALQEFNQVKNTDEYWNDGVRTEMFSASIKSWMNVPFTSISDDFYSRYKSVLGENVSIKNQFARENYKDNKIELVKTLKRLKAKVLTDPDNAADYYYMIGNSYYNRSVLGWFVNSIYYIGNDGRNTFSNYNYSNDKVEMTGNHEDVLQTANNYFIKALEGKGSKETKAAATFMLAKTNLCEDGTYNRDKGYYELGICGFHTQYFDNLINEYSDTEYYQEVLRECSWFREYAR